MILATFIFVIVLLFAWLKGYSLIAPLLPLYATPFVVVGLSYILFRILHLLIDVAQGDKSLPPLLGYINYCLFFPVFVSGPIQRYEDFEAQMRQPPPPLTVLVLHHALCRILLGIVFILAFSELASSAVNGFTKLYLASAPVHAEWVKSVLCFSVVSFAVLVKLYTNFAGSMHIIIGVGTLVGFTLPENFNKPYLAKNFLDFWARWHITLSEWIKFYLFNPLLKCLVRNFPSVAEEYLGAIAFFVAFMTIGLWHGTTMLFVVFGLMLGLAAITNKLWQQFWRKRLGKAGYKSLTEQIWYFQISRGLTLSYIAIALICLWLEPKSIQAVGILWLSLIGVLSVIIMTIGLALFGGFADWAIRLLPDKINGLLLAPLSERAMILWMAIMIWAMINFVIAFGSNTPELIYKGF